MHLKRATLASLMALTILFTASVGIAAAAELRQSTAPAVVGNGTTRTTYFDHDHNWGGCSGATGWYDVRYETNYSYTAGSSYITINWVRVTYYVHSWGILNYRIILYGLDHSNSYAVNMEVYAGQTKSVYYPVDPNQTYRFANYAGSFSVIGEAIHSLTWEDQCMTEDYTNITKP